MNQSEEGKVSKEGVGLRSGDVVLVDMDSVIVDWDGSFLSRWLPKHPEDEAVVKNRKFYEIELNFPREVREEVVKVIAEPGMYFEMKPLPGAIEGINDMLSKGLDVFIVTAPHPTCYPSCAAEKYQWVQKYLGDKWLPRVIIARDKTHVRGKILIDDKPHVSGSALPQWKQVVFEQPWNRDVTDKPRMKDWSDWKASLGYH